MNTLNAINDSISASSNVSISFISLINEACQKQQIALPDYEISIEKFGSILKYRCSIRNFCEYPSVISDAMSSKKAAKNEAAKQIYEFMKNNSKIDDNSINMNITKSIHSESPSEVIHVIKSIFDSSNEEPLDPATLIPVVMASLTHLSQICYPGKPALEGIYEMIDQWKVFLD